MVIAEFSVKCGPSLNEIRLLELDLNFWKIKPMFSVLFLP